eukprot:CAMPEP_0116870342 /NCGR_PEP_ID=MMETSP0463-20121206/219_1 /TAXON_ID=181622 /ORGANISM="Strombidinopsis sp, Strain SopsisLIS2011" /LENGTH=127 /DNA_ID=CAMNT_0004506721 /DNA_START=51 /DNA_END=434 /DNA_ORIENTATION=+
MVLISKENKRFIYAYLLREGVIVVKKDSYLPKHQNIPEVSNLEVQMVVKSLKSRGFLADVFNWQWGYYTLTNSGVKYLVKELGVSADVVPATFKKKKTITTGPKAVDDDEKETPEEGRATGIGRGQR